MDKTKINHGYSTRRNKIPKLELNNHENRSSEKNSPLYNKIESPSTAKLCNILYGYASPPCKPIISSQVAENEVEWDLTSPGAIKCQVFLSDKKTSTPNRTPTRRRELRPRLALCKKNIVALSSDNQDLANDLAVLNDLVNTEPSVESTLMTPPSSVKGLTTEVVDSSSLSNCGKENVTSKSNDGLNASDFFEDNSFFSESILLSTQALEQEAVMAQCDSQSNVKYFNGVSRSPTPSKSKSKYKSPSEHSGRNIKTRRCFDIDETDSFMISHKDSSCGTIDEVSDQTTSSTNSFRMPNASSEVLNSQKDRNKLPFKEEKKFAQSTVSRSPAVTRPIMQSSVGSSKSRAVTSINQTPPRGATNNSSLQPVKSLNNRNNAPIMRHAPAQHSSLTKHVDCKDFGIKRLPDLPVKSSSGNGNNQTKHTELQKVSSMAIKKPVDDLFGDDDDDLLCAIAEQVENQYVMSTCNKKVDSSVDSDADFFKPEVLDFISQLESQAMLPPKSTAVLMEEKRQAAIRKREQRLMSRRH